MWHDNWSLPAQSFGLKDFCNTAHAQVYCQHCYGKLETSWNHQIPIAQQDEETSTLGPADSDAVKTKCPSALATEANNFNTGLGMMQVTELFARRCLLMVIMVMLWLKS